jgi:hypothetical protein
VNLFTSIHVAQLRVLPVCRYPHCKNSGLHCWTQLYRLTQPIWTIFLVPHPNRNRGHSLDVSSSSSFIHSSNREDTRTLARPGYECQRMRISPIHSGSAPATPARGQSSPRSRSIPTGPQRANERSTYGAACRVATAAGHAMHGPRAHSPSPAAKPNQSTASLVPGMRSLESNEGAGQSGGLMATLRMPTQILLTWKLIRSHPPLNCTSMIGSKQTKEELFWKSEEICEQLT